MNLTLGVAAHVDAGKTTLCEQLLRRAGVIRACGRVDHGDAFMDDDPMERARGRRGLPEKRRVLRLKLRPAPGEVKTAGIRPHRQLMHPPASQCPHALWYHSRSVSRGSSVTAPLTRPSGCPQCRNVCRKPAHPHADVRPAVAAGPAHPQNLLVLHAAPSVSGFSPPILSNTSSGDLSGGSSNPAAPAWPLSLSRILT